MNWSNGLKKIWWKILNHQIFKSEKKKILIRIGSLRHGGAEKVLVTFLKALPEDKYDIDLLLNLKSGKYLKEVPSWVNILHLNKGEMITTNRPKDIPVKVWRKLYQGILKRFPKLLYRFILKNKKYDVEFAAIHGMSDEILNSPQKDSKKLVWIHNDLSEVAGYTTDKIKKLFEMDAVMVISEKIEQMFLELADSPEKQSKIRRIYNPIDTEEIISLTKKGIEDAELEEFINREDLGPLFVGVGTIFPQKGFDRLLNVHKKLLEEGLHHRILIIGDGYDMPATLKIRNDLKLQDSAVFAGFRQNPYPIINKADYFILPSRYEGFPTVLFEAITLGKKIIATDVSGAAEILDKGNLGLIVENSEEGIYEGMKEALASPDKFNIYPENIRNFKVPFSLENSVQNIQKIIDEL